MKFDANALHALTAKNDRELWAAIRMIAAKNGLSLAEEAPPPSEMERLRGILSGAEKLSPSDAMKIVNDFKKKGGR